MFIVLDRTDTDTTNITEESSSRGYRGLSVVDLGMKGADLEEVHVAPTVAVLRGVVSSRNAREGRMQL